VVVVAIAIYYAYKIVRLSREREFVALRGGRAPYYIILGLIFLELDRVFDLLTNYLSGIFGYQITVTFNDPPAALAAVFIMLGLREMYTVYLKDSKLAMSVPSPQEIWESENTAEPVAPVQTSLGLAADSLERRGQKTGPDGRVGDDVSPGVEHDFEGLEDDAGVLQRHLRDEDGL